MHLHTFFLSALLFLVFGTQLLPAQKGSATKASTAGATGVVEGLVRGPDGEPHPNVEVFATARRIGGEVLGRSRTDGEGMYVLAHLPLTTCQLCARAPGYTTASVPAVLSADRPHLGVNLRIYEANTIRGRVVNARGEPVADAFVIGTKDRCRWVGGLRAAEARTDADGRFELQGVPIGTSVFRAWKPGHRLRPHWLTTSKDAELNITLHGGNGTVLTISTEGLPKHAMAGAQVSLRGTRGSASFALPSSLQLHSLDASGSLRIAGLPKAAWHVSLTHPDYVMQTRSLTTDVEEPSPKVHFVASKDGGSRLRGTLTDSNGKRMANQVVIARRMRGSSWSDLLPFQATTDAEGKFSITTSFVDAEPMYFALLGSDHVLAQEKRGMLSWHTPSAWMTWERGADVRREIHLVAERGASLEVSVHRAGGQPIPLATAQLQVYYRKRWHRIASATSRRDGTVHFPSVTAVGEDCRVLCAGLVATDAAPFLLRAGQNVKQRLIYPAPGTVKGRVLDPQGKPKAGITVMMGKYFEGPGTRSFQVGTWVPTNRLGEFVFTDVPLGRHVVMLGLNGVRGEDFDVAAGQVVEANLTTTK
ncbi:MAG: hypothetical protein ACI91B_001765 [Planctomycetota bacterium]|jgi:hypothetical protein